ncbi:MAG: winged helix-turn-helix domain-containing protein [Candidatus Bathyarchaeia archaeon]
MGRRRDEFTVLMDLLDVALNEVKVTHLMYKANLSYSTLRKYLSTALNKGLIAKVHDSDGSEVYRTTKKGRELLAKLRDINNCLHE